MSRARFSVLFTAVIGLAAGCSGPGGDDDSDASPTPPESPTPGDSPTPGGTSSPTPAGSSPTPDPNESPTPVAWELARSDVPYDSSPDVSGSELDALVAGNTAFAVDLYQAHREGDGNLFFSPYSISVALAMTWAGARNDTESQMADTLHFTLDQATLHPAFNALGIALEQRAVPQEGDDGERVQLSIANSIWGQVGFPFEQEFLDVQAESYDAGLRLLDFETAPEPSRLIINEWVLDQTQGRIEDLIPEGAIDDLTRLVLANAIYFKGSWSVPFLEESTKPADFHLLDGSEVQVDMMNQREDYGYASGTGYQAIELPYVGEEVSMVVILPDEGTFEDFESTLEASTLEAIFGDLQDRDINLFMPKFGFEARLTGLAPTLGELGMPDAIDPYKADFSGMSPDTGLYITSVEHMAFVAVDEAGTEAAAATAVIIGDESAPEPVRVDRPFLFLIRDRLTDAVLFLGRVVDPG